MKQLLLLHGMLQAPTVWESLIQTVSDDFPAWTFASPWLPGHGPMPWRIPPNATFESALSEYRDELPKQVDAIVGYSMGGRLALKLLEFEIWKGPVLAFSAHLGIESSEVRRDRAVADAADAEWLEREGIDEFARAWELRPVVQLRSSVPEAVRLQLARTRRSHAPDAVAASLRVLGTGNMGPVPSQVFASPFARLVYGGEDAKFLNMAGFARSRGAEVDVIPEAGHNIILDAPSQAANVLRQFLTSIE